MWHSKHAPEDVNDEVEPTALRSEPTEELLSSGAGPRRVDPEEDPRWWALAARRIGS
jgi:hypothetical protein